MKRGLFWLIVWLSLWAFSGWAAQGGRDMKREGEIEQELAKINPALVEPFRAARIAFDQDDYAGSEGWLREVCTKAPAFDAAARRLGASLVRQGKRAEGLGFCEKAVTLNRSTENLLSLAYCLIPETPDGSLTNETRAMQLLRECRAMPGGTDLDVLAFTAQVALRLNSMTEFRTAVELLRQKHPQAMLTHYLTAIEAANDGHWMRAEKEIKAAQELGLPHQAAQSFLDSGVHSRALGWRIAYYVAAITGIWIGGLVLLYAVGVLLSRLTLRQVEVADIQVKVSGGERRLRQIYRAVLNLAGVYYYLSLPVVIVMVITIVAGVMFGFLLVGWIPIKLMLILGIGALVTVVTMVRSLFIRVKAEEPGRPLAREEAEGLWSLTSEVAQSVNTRPIDEIRITPGTELAVYERGGWREKLQNKARRILILGTGVLNGFKQDDFRCVLAHEYGHFSHRDTAGGDIGLRVRNDMLKFYFAMRAAGQATYLNAAFHFLRIYNFIFRRISHGATRLQEILADRIAAQTYGAPALEGGLKHVIRRSLEFDALANTEIKEGIEMHRPLQNLYELPPAQSATIETEFDNALHRKTTDDDTHPSPADRFRFVAQLRNPSCAPRSGEVWELFKDREAITREMMTTLEQRIAQYRASTGAPDAKE